MNGSIWLVSGIDTEIGKSIATGMLARALAARGGNVATQKLVQTGSHGVSPDIEVHRRLMQTGPLAEDDAGLTCSEVFEFPASPHLAAELEHRVVDIGRVDRITAMLAERYDHVLLEGAGGLMVPLTRGLSTLDFAVARRYPVVLVTSGRLGSLNHTLLSLEAVKNHGAQLAGMIFNRGDAADPVIERDTREWLLAELAKEWPGAWFADLPRVDFLHPERTELEYARN